MKIVKTGQFNEDQLRIEDHTFHSNNEDIKYVDKFLDELDNAVIWIKANATTPKEDDVGDRSWPFYRDGKGKLRYRLKYLMADTTPPTIFLKRIIDNKEQNLDLYPAHRLDSYSADDE
jgi:hypothetical protein